jgi:hypothetical protein
LQKCCNRRTKLMLQSVFHKAIQRCDGHLLKSCYTVINGNV